MDQKNIKSFLDSFSKKRERTIVIVDFGNVEKWKHGLGWPVGIRELRALVRHFTYGKKFLRKFYYGEDYGPSEKSTNLTDWSKHILRTAENNGFEIVSKRVKYIPTVENVHGFQKKCDLDVEMAVDLIRERDNYNTIVLFSGDGDFFAVLKYLNEEYNKEVIVMGARGHIGREIIDAKKNGIVKKIIFADNFEYRLNMKRFQKD